MMRTLLVLLIGCGPQTRPSNPMEPSPIPSANAVTPIQLVSVTTSGEPGAYSFAVGIQSEETGCEHYANWWEVLDESGDLLYRRILGHSHVNEQPFVRSGGPVPIREDQRVWIRGHHEPEGDSSPWFGSVQDGFQPMAMSESLRSLADQPPLPDGCAF